ncbi:MAG TPA: tRNA pseudouridine(55) synthase TruB [Terriglobales bacterium]|jgi:tRNA pseudouridine55 synthase|nr:tRNA pseudouridine(55) synthase TruB [Terriglobales bacterium]
MNGVVIIDKPSGLTSHDVVNRVRGILGQRSVGHLGTLDPSATGVLPIVVGNLTRLAQFYTHSEKIYEGVIRFGFATDTYDADGEPTTHRQDVTINCEELRALAMQFQGIIEQMPPPFSAKKIAGVRAYKLARKKQEVTLKPVRVEIKQFEILDTNGDQATFRTQVASGTYIRSVAHDMGQKQGCGAHLASLRRTAVAEFVIEDAHSLTTLETAMQQGIVESLFVHPRMLAPQLPSVTANEECVAFIRSGRAVNLPEMSRAPQVKVFYGQRDLIAIATRIAGTLFHPGIVFTG